MPRTIVEAAIAHRQEWPTRAEQFRRVDEWIGEMIASSVESHLKRIKKKCRSRPKPKRGKKVSAQKKRAVKRNARHR